MRKYELVEEDLTALFKKWQDLKRTQSSKIIHGVTFGYGRRVTFFGADCNTLLLTGGINKCHHTLNGVRYIQNPCDFVNNIIMPHCVTNGIHLTITNISQS